jgi:hypothetical protein
VVFDKGDEEEAVLSMDGIFVMVSCLAGHVYASTYIS